MLNVDAEISMFFNFIIFDRQISTFSIYDADLTLATVEHALNAQWAV